MLLLEHMIVMMIKNKVPLLHWILMEKDEVKKFDWKELDDMNVWVDVGNNYFEHCFISEYISCFIIRYFDIHKIFDVIQMN